MISNFRLPFVLVAADHGPMIVSILDWGGGEKNNTQGVSQEIMYNGAYEQDLINLSLMALEHRKNDKGPGVLALDCGANVGVYTIEFGKHMREWGDVISFEPQSRIFYALAGNVAINNLFNAYPIYAAVGDREGVIKVPDIDYSKNSNYGGLSLKHQGHSIGQPIPENHTDVRILTIDSMNLPRVDFIKADVEGMELEILNGALNTVKRDQPYIMVEWTLTGRDVIEKYMELIDYETVRCNINLMCGPKGNPVVNEIRKFKALNNVVDN